jgi:uncharacterized protein YcbK (DUF882 family)
MNGIRRRLLSTGALLAGATAFGPLASRARAQPASPAAAAWGTAPPEFAALQPPLGSLAPSPTRASARLVLHNLHTEESLEVEYLREGQYVPEELVKLDVLLRDFRTGDRHPIDPALFDILHAVASRLGVHPEFGVISGYRSPRTNARLHELSAGVATRSMHLQGRAIDVRLARVDCAALAGAGLELAQGGVGYYRRSDFVHLDTGAVRRWSG